MSSATLELVPLHGANRQGPTNRKGVDMTKTSGTYRINLGNGWFYVGSSNNLGLRRRDHLTLLRNGHHKNEIVQRCFNKYGIFEFVILELCGEGDRISKEQDLLDAHCRETKCANIAKDARAPMLGRKHTDATRKAISDKHIGVPKSDAAKAAMSKAWETRPPFSDADKAAMSKARRKFWAPHLARQQIEYAPKTIEDTLCKCGCGQVTPIATRTRKHLGHIKFKHIDYLLGHAARGRKRVFTQEHKDNIAKGTTGRVPWNKGIPWPEEIREKMRGHGESKRGKNNPNWKHGRRCA